jgi:hypothetical protein
MPPLTACSHLYSYTAVAACCYCCRCTPSAPATYTAKLQQQQQQPPPPPPPPQRRQQSLWRTLQDKLQERTKAGDSSEAASDGSSSAASGTATSTTAVATAAAAAASAAASAALTAEELTYLARLDDGSHLYSLFRRLCELCVQRPTVHVRALIWSEGLDAAEVAEVRRVYAGVLTTCLKP